MVHVKGFSTLSRAKHVLGGLASAGTETPQRKRTSTCQWAPSRDSLQAAFEAEKHLQQLRKRIQGPSTRARVRPCALLLSAQRTSAKDPLQGNVTLRREAQGIF